MGGPSSVSRRQAVAVIFIAPYESLNSALREPYESLTRALESIKRAIESIKRAVESMKRVVESIKRALDSIKEPQLGVSRGVARWQLCSC